MELGITKGSRTATESAVAQNPGTHRDTYPSVRPYLPHSFVATTAVVGVPFLVTLLLINAREPDPPILVVAAAGVLTSLLMIVLGTALWLRRPASSFIGFGDLMIARWMKRLRAERQLHEGARMLGLDRSGQPVTRGTFSGP